MHRTRPLSCLELVTEGVTSSCEPCAVDSLSIVHVNGCSTTYLDRSP